MGLIFHNSAVLVGCTTDMQFTILHAKPGPAGTKAAKRCFFKFVFEVGNITKLFSNSLGQFATRFAATVRRHKIPEKTMIGVPACVIAYSRTNIFRYFIEVSY